MKNLTLLITVCILLGSLWLLSNNQEVALPITEKKLESSKAKLKSKKTESTPLAAPSVSAPIKETQELEVAVDDGLKPSSTIQAIEKNDSKDTQDEVARPPLAFSPYTVKITEQDSPLGRLTKNLKDLKDLPLLEHFDKAPSLRFLTGKYVGILKKQDQVGILRFALYFKDNNLDHLSEKSCVGLMFPTEIKTIGDVQSRTVDVHFLKGQSENQKSLVVNLKNELILHVWQIDKREKAAWVKVYKVDKNQNLQELFYTQLIEDQENFKVCKNI